MVKKISLALLLILALAGRAPASVQPLLNDDGLYVIESVEQLKLFRDAVNNGWADLNAVLSGDLDLGGQSWTPIGNSEDTAYNGSFNGGEFFLRGLSVRGGEPLLGLFGCLDYGSVVSNLNVEGALIVFGGGTGVSAGVIAGKGKGIIDNCSVIKSKVNITVDEENTEKASAAAGAVAGYNHEGIIIDCVSRQNDIHISGSRTNDFETTAGGICGMNLGTMPGMGLIMSCEARGNEIVIKAGNKCSGGGIMGTALGGIARRCETYGGKIAGSGHDNCSSALGGIIGMSILGSYLENCTVGGELLIHSDKGAAGTSIGGLAGELVGSSVSGCLVKDVILSASGKGAHSMGGIIGVLANGKISDCRVANILMPKHYEKTACLGAVAGLVLTLDGMGDDISRDIVIENIYFQKTIAGGVAIGNNRSSAETVTIPFDMTVSPDLFK